MSTDEGNYQVGYKKPPLGTRFQKGQSGNPSGRRKRALRPDELMERELSRRVTLSVGGGKKETRTKREWFYARMVQMAVDGNNDAMKLLAAHDDRRIKAMMMEATIAAPRERWVIRMKLEDDPDDDHLLGQPIN